MKLIKAGLATLILASSALLAGCGQSEQASEGKVAEQQTFKWKLVTAWPKNYPGLGSAPEKFARDVNKMSNGRLTVKVYGDKELVPGLQVFDAVSNGTAEMGHAAAYYWKGKAPATQFFTTIPFGMTAQETNAWIHYGGGLELWREVYAPFNVIPMAGGNSGVQFAGWFKKEINSLEDFEGLKMRIPGLGGEVLKRLGGLPVTMTGGELFTALQTGAIDATEWVGPYNDLAFGFHKAAEHYYYTGWHEPGSMLEFLINKDAYAALPEDLQAIVEVAARAANQDMLDEYTARNINALRALQNEHKVDMRPFPDDVIRALKKVSLEVINEQAAQDPQMQKVWDSYREFQEGVMAYHKISELEYMQNREK